MSSTENRENEEPRRADSEETIEDEDIEEEGVEDEEEEYDDIRFVGEESEDEEKEEAEESEDDDDYKASGDVAAFDVDSEKPKGNQVLTLDQLESEVTGIVTDVKNILEVSPGVAQILLLKFSWNKELLLEKFYETSDIQQFMIDNEVIPSVMEELPQEEFGDCMICFENVLLVGLACNHLFCFGCWNSYLTEKIIDAKQSEITCMHGGCKLLFQQEQISFYITDPVVMALYNRAVVDSYVATNRLLKWCHGADCDNALKVTLKSTRHVACTCGSSFCFSCNQDSHEPVPCRLLVLWTKNDQKDDAESFKWILGNTKECPKCQAPIEKNGGCNHMTCTNKSCRYEFCWLCMGNWIGHRQCNVFVATGDSNREKTLANLQRFEFFKTRYLGHQQSLKYENDLRTEIIFKMEQLKEFFDLASSEVVYLEKALKVLTECRRTLMYSYIFAYYLEPNFNSEIFEGNQQDLQSATEQLSEILERKLEDDDLDSLKQRVMEKYQYVEQRRQCLLDHCAEGEENDYWAYHA
ncbi:hypothetical protein B9Z55_015267 [Caenorhabditis nigoni]|uniref:RBR-type E3 ubiquitin transferase n=1 Tax=Caenorhabditis nigoni TaxID=1611254 RepID=A0A2G5U9G4_9PELO|nr:hypothetical protein B9Z55_015267 [Caenorhabditis nigoni]